MQNFNKHDYVVGNTVYLLFLGGYRQDPEKIIVEAVIKAVGKKYITVLKGIRELRFEYDIETKSIWQKKKIMVVIMKFILRKKMLWKP